MKRFGAVILSWLVCATVHADSDFVKVSTRIQNRPLDSVIALQQLDVNPTTLYPAHTFSVAVDHFHNESMYEPHSNSNFTMRYWFDATYYKPGGPVIMLASGESAGEARLPYLQKGIVYELAKATNGLGVILEHRYYGSSFPVPITNLSTSSLRFLTTQQSLADTAVFAQNIVFPGLETVNLTASGTPWIIYGGSYAGAYVAFLRKLYPTIFWGAISSSGVTEAINDYWQYWVPIKNHGPQPCIAHTVKITHAMDNILLKPKNAPLIPQLKALWGLPNVTSSADFMSVLVGIGGWQSLNWDPSVSTTSVATYCNILSNTTRLYNSTAAMTAGVEAMLTAGGYADELDTLTTPMLNWIGWIQQREVRSCTNAHLTQDQCFGSYDASDYKISVGSSWPYQVCTQWGYYQTGSGDPSLPLISRTIDVPYSNKSCAYTFGITTPPNVTAINQWGGFGITYPRLAFIGGAEDPWRPSTPLAASNKPWPKSTTSEPVYLIPGAVHHWDENGIFPNETTATVPPKSINKVHAFEVEFVQEWLKEAQGLFPSVA